MLMGGFVLLSCLFFGVRCPGQLHSMTSARQLHGIAVSVSYQWTFFFFITEHASMNILMSWFSCASITVGEMLEVELLRWRAMPIYNFYSCC